VIVGEDICPKKASHTIYKNENGIAKFDSPRSEQAIRSRQRADEGFHIMKFELAGIS
jgi:hypothetical protein